jgi:hypothetical protein
MKCIYCSPTTAVEYFQRVLFTSKENENNSRRKELNKRDRMRDKHEEISQKVEQNTKSKQNREPGTVAHTCNPICLEG